MWCTYTHAGKILTHTHKINLGRREKSFLGSVLLAYCSVSTNEKDQREARVHTSRLSCGSLLGERSLPLGHWGSEGWGRGYPKHRIPVAGILTPELLQPLTVAL